MAGLKVLGLDFDNTLVDSLPAMQHAVKTVLDRCGLDTGYASEQDILDSSPMRILRSAGVSDAQRKSYWPVYIRTVLDSGELFGGMNEAIERLPEPVTLGIVSSTPTRILEAYLSKRGLSSRFAHILGYREVGRPKPAPDGILRLAVRCRVPPSSVVYVGDQPVDIRSAQAAGAHSATGMWSRGRRDATLSQNPDSVLRVPTEIVDLFA